MAHPAYPLRTPRLLLRPVTLGDLDDVHAHVHAILADEWRRR